MSIVDIQYYPYRLPLRGSFSTAHSVLAAREGAIVEIRTADGISGVGEIAPLPEFGGGNLVDALAALSTLAVRLCGQTPVAALDYVYASIEASSIPTSTACGLESALLDVLGKERGQNVGMLLCPPRRDSIYRVRNLLHDVSATQRASAEAADALKRVPTKDWVPVNAGAEAADAINRVPTGYEQVPRSLVPVNAVVGAATVEGVVRRAREVVSAGFRCVKLKMGSGEWTVETEIERVAAVRAAIGLGVQLRLDANEAWGFAQARAILTACAQYVIQYVEQPLQASNLAGMRVLRQAVSIPIAADEAVYSLESARRVLAEEAADVLVVKPQLAGGLYVGRQIIQEAVQHGVSCVVTSTIESGVGVVGALHLAAVSPEVTLECGLATLSLLEDDLLLDDLTVQDGFMAVPAGPGLGVRLDQVALEKCIFK